MCTVLLPPGVQPIAVNKYKVIKKSLCTWFQHRKLHVMFKVSPASLRHLLTRRTVFSIVDTTRTLTPSVISNSNYVIVVSDWNCLKYFCVIFYTVIIRCTEIFDHPVYHISYHMIRLIGWNNAYSPRNFMKANIHLSLSLFTRRCSLLSRGQPCSMLSNWASNHKGGSLLTHRNCCHKKNCWSIGDEGWRYQGVAGSELNMKESERALQQLLTVITLTWQLACGWHCT
jgi:hypothetical protein